MEDIAQLFNLAKGDNADADSALRALHHLGTEGVLDQAISWTRSQDPVERACALDVLGQIGVTSGNSNNRYPEIAFNAIADTLKHETDIHVLCSALISSAHLRDHRAIPLCLLLIEHPDSELRYAVACALGSMSNNPEAAAGLIALTHDSDPKVRDWATFGLGVLGELDSPEIRQALMDRIDDSDNDVREEAAAGLAKRMDLRILPMLIAMLKGPEVPVRAIEAADLLLNKKDSPDQSDWSGEEYSARLKIRFGLAD